MELISLVTGTIFILAIAAVIVTMIKFPKDVFVNLPLGFLKLSAERFLITIVIATSPIWFPIFLIDTWFKWRIFDHPIFNIFKDKEDEGLNHFDLPDSSYKADRKLAIETSLYEWYFLSPKDGELISQSLKDGIDSLNKAPKSYTHLRIGRLHLIQVSEIKLYDFFYLIQWLQTEFPSLGIYGFAKSSSFSFFGQNDPKTLNNIIGRTSNQDLYSYNLTEGESEVLKLNSKLKYNSKFDTFFFNELLTSHIKDKKAQKTNSTK